MAKLVMESAMAAAGVNVVAAKEALAKLDAAFAGEAGDIPDGALKAWVIEHFPLNVAQQFFLLVGKAWEGDHTATLPKERAWEREPGASKVKA